MYLARLYLHHYISKVSAQTRHLEVPAVSEDADSDEHWRARLEGHVAQLAARSGTTPPPVVIHDGIANAGSDGQRIALNPDWAREVTASICRTDGRCKEELLKGVAAHEFAHHLRHGAPVQDPHAEELRADRWAAQALIEQGASLVPYLRLVGSGPERESATHPAASQRRRAIEASCRGCAECSQTEPQPVLPWERVMSKRDDKSDPRRRDAAPFQLVPPSPAGERPRPKPSELDDYVEDLIDPSYGAYSSRQVVRASAEKMLQGFEGLLPKRGRGGERDNQD